MAENDMEALAVELEHVMTMHPVGTYISVDPRLAQTILTALRSTTAATDSAAKDAEIAAYREALEKIRGYSDPNGMTRRRMKAIAVAALANRGEAGALAKERGE